MRSVWKFPLRRDDLQTVPMPRGARPLTVAMQDGVPTMWALVDSLSPVEERSVVLVGTGHPAPDPAFASYVGTVFDGPWVWHFFIEA